ncbi:MAG: hypothetical protein JXR39_01270 [Marinilabiliaceae bacterium]|nr:hypothetical protein [Marinilabiliaceae bacterium]
MIRPQKRKLVNWQECMSVKADHFKQMEDFFIESVSMSQALVVSGFNYGLLPVGGELDNSEGIRIREHVTGHVEITLRHCSAVTASGLRISYHPGEGESLVRDYSPESESRGSVEKEVMHWDVILSVDPYRRKPTGAPHPGEIPPRHPDAESDYSLHVMPMGEIRTHEYGVHHLIIGRIRKHSGRFEVDGNYIPPCRCMASHPELMNYYHRFGSYLSGLEKSSKVILSKVVNRSSHSELSNNMGILCQELLRYISMVYFNYRNLGRHYAPVEVVNCFSTLGHVIYVGLTYLKNHEKEEMLRYFYEWSDVTPGSFEEMLANVLELIYDHSHIRSTMVQLDSFLTTLTELWNKLSQLEYIGQHKENIIVSERMHQSDMVQKVGWSIMD